MAALLAPLLGFGLSGSSSAYGAATTTAAGPATHVPRLQPGAYPSGRGGSGRQSGARFHTVRRGESLWQIARAYVGGLDAEGSIAREVVRLEALNAGRITDPDVIQAGQRLRLPTRGHRLEAGVGFGRVGGSRRVRGLQRALRRRGYAPGPVDGLFGPNTAAAVRRFQKAHGLKVDGIVDALTERTLHPRAPLVTSPRSAGPPPVLTRSEPVSSRPPVQGARERGRVWLWIVAFVMALAPALASARFLRRGEQARAAGGDSTTRARVCFALPGSGSHPVWSVLPAAGAYATATLRTRRRTGAQPGRDTPAGSVGGS